MKLALTTVMVGALLAFKFADAALPVSVDGRPLPSLAPMLEQVQRSVVTISSEANVQVRRADPFFDDPFFRRFFDQRRSTQTRKRQTIGTGVIVDADQGLVLTNELTVAGAARITVTMHDGREATGSVVGRDHTSDIALIKIDATGLEAIPIGDSDQLKVGDFVVSIGHPLGYQSTITSGIVSALGRAGRDSHGYESFIQSDAVMGPGILLNLRGEMIGLNFSKVAKTANNARIGFSTPINVAFKVKSQLVKYGAPQRGFLAIQIQDLTPDLASAFNIGERRGAVITSVSKGSSADRAGLQVGDVVLMVDDRIINRGVDLRNVIGRHFAGDEVEFTVLRDGETVIVPAKLESSTTASSKGTMIHHQLEGATFKEVGPQQISTNAEEGVLVTDVKKGSVAWNHGVRANDLIVSANRKSVNDLTSLRKAIADQDVVMLNIVRGNGALFLLLQ